MINLKDSQLIMATHESSLLTQKLLRKDEIWFISSKINKELGLLNSLQEYNVRFDKELRNSYLKGRFNGVPNLGEPEDLPFN